MWLLCWVFSHCPCLEPRWDIGLGPCLWSSRWECNTWILLSSKHASCTPTLLKHFLVLESYHGSGLMTGQTKVMKKTNFAFHFWAFLLEMIVHVPSKSSIPGMDVFSMQSNSCFRFSLTFLATSKLRNLPVLCSLPSSPILLQLWELCDF